MTVPTTFIVDLIKNCKKVEKAVSSRIKRPNTEGDQS